MSKMIKSSGNITINANDTVFIDGNFTVSGTTTTVNTTNTDILDRVITLNKGESSAGVTGVYSGLDIDRGTSPNVGLRWNEGSDRWELTVDGTTWDIIITGATAGISNVVEDLSPQLGGDLDLNGNDITGNGNVSINGSIGLTGNIVLDEGEATEVTVYADTVSGGGTGVYFTSPTTSGELISKKKAIVYSIIFG